MFLEADFWMGLLTIIAIDLVLAGDNAVVIALASRNLPLAQRNKAILWGTFGAVIIRIVMTIGAVWLLKIPFLQAIGGLLLLYVAVKLLKNEDESENIKAEASLIQAIKTIIVADLIMGVDNVLAIAGAAHGNIWLVVIGLAVSVPIVVWGSKWITSLMDRYPIIVYVGSIILAWTSGTMIVHDTRVGEYIAGMAWVSWAVHILAIGLVLLFGWLQNNSKKKATTGENEEETRVV